MIAALSDNEPSPVSLDGMTKTELLQYAAANGVDGVNSAMKKAEIIAAIINAE